MTSSPPAPFAVRAAGMISGVGNSWPASCAAIRAAVDNFSETRFIDEGGEWIIASQVTLDEPWRGREKLLRMAASAIKECLDAAAAKPSIPPSEIPLVLCLPEESRPGRFEALDASLIPDIATLLGVAFHPTSSIVTNGRVGGVVALLAARELFAQGRRAVIVCGTDTFLTAPTLAHYEKQRRLLTSKNSDGFIPGEAAAAVLLVPHKDAQPTDLLCTGLALAREPAPLDSGKPCKGEGLKQAVVAALKEANHDITETQYRIADVAGEQFYFREAALMLLGTVRKRVEFYDLWTPFDCTAQIGAAAAPAIVSLALAAARKGYAPGPRALCHFANDTDERAALVLAAGGTP